METIDEKKPVWKLLESNKEFSTYYMLLKNVMHLKICGTNYMQDINVRPGQISTFTSRGSYNE